MEIPMIYYVVVSTIMFFAGVYGFVTRHNLLAILISLELMLNAVDINFVVFNRYLFPGQLEGFFCRGYCRSRDRDCDSDYY
mgnify:CR=1 FL=1